MVVVIPARNEAPTVGRVVADAKRHWSRIFVVDDGSEDGTAAIASSCGAEVLRHPLSLGYGAALRTGLTEAVRVGAECAILLDADGAHDPHESPDLVAAHRSVGADLTIGTRFQRSDPWFPTPKRDANMLARLIFNMMYGTQVSDVASGFRVLGPRLLNAGIANSDFGAAFELLAYAARSQLVLHEAPISVRYNAEEPFCTGRGELVDFIKACSNGGNNALSVNFLRFGSAVKRAETCAVAIGSERFHLHYIQHSDGYLIQRQHPWFDELRVSRSFKMSGSFHLSETTAEVDD